MPNPTESAVQPGKTAFHSMTREQLLLALEMFAKNWLAHDGCWFLAAEESLGMDAAIELDTAAWRRFAATEANRIMAAFSIPSAGGLRALERPLGLRQYSLINSQRTEWSQTAHACASSWMFAASRKPGGARGSRISLASPSAQSSSRLSRAPLTLVFRRGVCTAHRSLRKANIAAGSSA